MKPIATSDSGNESSSDGEQKEPAPMSLSSDEVNYLIYRYLQVRSTDTGRYGEIPGRGWTVVDEYSVEILNDE
jgi:hypothetical protein